MTPSEYHIQGELLTIEGVPRECELETVVRIRPQDNTALSGLYLAVFLKRTAWRFVGELDPGDLDLLRRDLGSS